VNGIGVSDSGGVNVLEKLIKECLEVGGDNKFTFMLTNSEIINSLIKSYKSCEIFTFKTLTFKSYVHRLYYENVTFRKIIIQYDVDLIYNFTGSTQFFLECPQLVKMHNLLFYSKKVDRCYRENAGFILWIRQVFLKRVVFRFMLDKSKYIEIQSKHVEECLSNYLNIKNKHLFIKSDIEVVDGSFKEPRRYDFSKRIKFLYVVGPHFDYMHKNFLDFTKSMVELTKSDIDFEINITLTKDQLATSNLWDELLNTKTNFYGYINDPKKMEDLFCDNTILISTSIIETLGLHVVEAIKNGVVIITPNEDYANEVYGKDRYSYELFDSNSLSKTVMNVINDKKVISSRVLSQQVYLRANEIRKFNNIVDVFGEVLDVQG
jgi:hypothetical protein